MDINIYDLNKDIISKIIEFCDLRSYYQCQLTCKLFTLTPLQVNNLKINRGIGFCIENGFVEECKILLNKKINYNILENDKTYYLLVNCKKGNLEMLEWIWESKIFTLTYSLLMRCINTACFNGRLDVIKWIIEKCKKNNINIGIDQNSFESACDNDQYNIVKWILYDKGYNNLIVLCKGINISCRNNNLKIATLLYQRCQQLNHRISLNILELFTTVCEKGNINTVEWLYALSIEQNLKINIHFKDEYIFKFCCANSHLDVAKWLWLLGNNIDSPINIRSNEDYAFRKACNNNNIELIEWLLYISKLINSPIDIHVNKEEPFRNACEKGHLEIAQLLWHLSIKTDNPIDLSVNNFECFEKSCLNKHIQLVNWLSEIIVENNYKKRINETLLQKNSFKTECVWRDVCDLLKTITIN